MADADVLLQSLSLSEAAVRLQAHGWTLRGTFDNQASWFQGALNVDVHDSPLPRMFGRLTPATLFAHSDAADEIAGGVRTPSIVDAGVLAVAHYVIDLQGLLAPSRLPGDLQILSRHGLTPAALARALTEYGLRRTAVVAFESMCAVDRGWAPWLAALAPDDVDRRVARAWLATSPFVARLRRTSWVAPRLVTDHPSDTARAAVWRIAASFDRVLRRR